MKNIIIAAVAALVFTFPVLAADEKTPIIYITNDPPAAEETTAAPEEQTDYIDEISEAYGLPDEIVRAVIEVESSGDPKCKTGSCKGLMQINTAANGDLLEELGVTDIYDPYQNVTAGCRILSDHRAALGADEWHYVLMAYNGGMGYLRRMQKKGYTSSRYSRKVLELAGLGGDADGR